MPRNNPAVQFEPLLLGQLVDVARLDSGELEPAAQALTDGVRSLSWAAYVDRVARMAGALVAAGVRPGDRVAVRLAKSVDSFVVVHAVVRAGAVMVPLDPTAPTALAAAVLSDSGASMLVTDAPDTVIHDVTEGLTMRCVMVLGANARDTAALSTTFQVIVDRDIVGAAPVGQVPIEETAPAYIIYTSGSTGRPKGIVHSHRSALAYATAAAREYALTRHDRLAKRRGGAFRPVDVRAVLGASGRCCRGRDPRSRVAVPREHDGVAGSAARHGVVLGPVAADADRDSGRSSRAWLAALRWVLFGGESVPPGQLADLMRQLPAARFSNVYGPAEVNQCTFHHLSSPPAPDRAVPIGRPWSIATVRVVDLDDLDSPVRAGQVGILMVRTETRTSEYGIACRSHRCILIVDRMGETESIVGTSPVISWSSAMAVSWSSSARVDNQVKVRGHRIELEAIDAALGDIAGVGAAVTVVRRSPTGDDTVVAIVVPTVAFGRSSADVQGFGASVVKQLRHRLPRWSPFPPRWFSSTNCPEPARARSTVPPPSSSWIRDGGSIRTKWQAENDPRRPQVTVRDTGSAPDDVSAPDADLARRLIEFIVSQVVVEDGDIDVETDLLLTGLVDSLGVVMIVEWIETDQGVTIDPGDVVLENFQTVGAMLHYLAAT